MMGRRRRRRRRRKRRTEEDDEDEEEDDDDDGRGGGGGGGGKRRSNAKQHSLEHAREDEEQDVGRGWAAALQLDPVETSVHHRELSAAATCSSVVHRIVRASQSLCERVGGWVGECECVTIDQDQ
jgi:hypothetical protein